MSGSNTNANDNDNKKFLRVGEDNYLNKNHIAWFSTKGGRIMIETVTAQIFYINDAEDIEAFKKEFEISEGV